MTSEFSSKPTGTRFSFFVESADGIKGYLEVGIADVPVVLDSTGDPADPLDAFLGEFKRVSQWLASEGFKHDASFDKPARGGGKPPAKAETPPPADIPVPEHCGEKMVYKEAYTNPNSGNKVGAKFECRKGENCATPREYNGKKYGFSMWEDGYRRDLEAA